MLLLLLQQHFYRHLSACEAVVRQLHLGTAALAYSPQDGILP